MPFVGGYLACEAHVKYLEDQRAYNDGGVTEDYLFKEMGNLFKEYYWEFYGQFNRVTQDFYDKVVSEYEAKAEEIDKLQKALGFTSEFNIPDVDAIAKENE